MFKWIKDMKKKQEEADTYLASIIKMKEQDLRKSVIKLITGKIETVERCQNEMSQDEINLHLKENLEVISIYKITKEELENELSN